MGKGEQAAGGEGVSEWLEEGLRADERPTAWMDEAPLGRGEDDNEATETEAPSDPASKGGLVLGSGSGVFAALSAGLVAVEVLVRSRLYHEGARLALAPQAALLTVMLILTLALAWQDFWAWFGFKRPQGDERLAFISETGKGFKVLGEGVGVGIVACCVHIVLVLEHAGSRWEHAFPEATSVGGLALIGYTLGYILIHVATSMVVSPVADTNNIDRPVDFAGVATFLGGTLVGTLYYFEEMPFYGAGDEHLGMSVLSGVGAFILFQVTLFVLRLCLIVLRALLLVVAVPGLVILSALWVNPHCMETIEPNNIEEVAYCTLYSTIEPELDLPGREPWWQQFTARLQGEPGSGLMFASFDGGVPQVPEPDRGPGSLDVCMNALYEDPVKQMEAYGLHHYDFDHDLSHDIAFRALFKVCVRNQAHAIESLAPYYVAAAKREMWREAERLKGRVLPLPSPSTTQGCVFPDPYLPKQEIQDALARGMAALSLEQREVVSRFLLGHKLADIARDLKLPLALVKSRRYGAAKVLRNHLDGVRCHI